MELDEAQIQVLVSLGKAENDAGATHRAAIEAIGECYRDYREDWSGAFEALVAAGLVDGNDQTYSLTDKGRSLAEKYGRERADMYWYHYQKFYPAAHASPTHSLFCERVFGKDLCQEGQTDMASLDRLLELLDLKEHEKVIDLGCGAGVISEHISDITGTRVTGVDYAASAIAEADKRTVAKRSRLDFIQGDFSDLSLPANTYDVVVAIDTLYWGDILERLFSRLAQALRPGARMGIFLNHEILDGDSEEMLDARHSELWQVLSARGYTIEIYDFTRELREFWQRLHSTTIELRDAYEAEGNGFIVDNYLRESEQDHIPEIEAGRMVRYLYIVQT